MIGSWTNIKSYSQWKLKLFFILWKIATTKVVYFLLKLKKFFCFSGFSIQFFPVQKVDPIWNLYLFSSFTDSRCWPHSRPRGQGKNLGIRHTCNKHSQVCSSIEYRQKLNMEYSQFFDTGVMPKTSGSWGTIQIPDQTTIQSSTDFWSFEQNFWCHSFCFRFVL